MRFFAIQPFVFRRYKAELMITFTLGAKRVLEVGSGLKHYSRFCMAESYVSVDVAMRPDVLASATCLPFRSKCFDRVVMMDVLEHVNDIVTVLKECRRVLTRDGQLLIITPNTAGLGFYDSFADSTHQHHFTWNSLRTILKQNGFDVKQEIPIQLHVFFPFKSHRLRRLQQSICVVAVKQNEP